MTGDIIGKALTIFAGIVTVALVSTLVAKNTYTAQIIRAFGYTMASSICAATGGIPQYDRNGNYTGCKR